MVLRRFQHAPKDSVPTTSEIETKTEPISPVNIDKMFGGNEQAKSAAESNSVSPNTSAWKPRKSQRKSIFDADSPSSRIGELYSAEIADKQPKYIVYPPDLDRYKVIYIPSSLYLRYSPWKRKMRAISWFFAIVGGIGMVLTTPGHSDEHVLSGV